MMMHKFLFLISSFNNKKKDEIIDEDGDAFNKKTKKTRERERRLSVKFYPKPNWFTIAK